MNKTAPSGTSRKATTWCGPYALAVISGLDYDTVYKKMLRAYNRKALYKRKYITGVTDDLMETVSKTIKTPIEFQVITNKPTLKGYMDELYPNALYVITITGHYVVVDTSDWTVCDNQSMKWVPIAESKHKRCKVRSVACAKIKRRKV